MEIITLQAAPGKEVSLRHREGSSDLRAIAQIFAARDYDFQKTGRAAYMADAYRSILETEKLPIIIDAGANIGASAVYFASNFPYAKIVAIEPEATNFDLLVQNSKPFGNIECVQAALSATDGSAVVLDPGAGNWGFRTAVNGDAAVAAEASLGRVLALSVGRLLDTLGDLYAPFIVKIDIEGAEQDVFSANTDWVDRFPCLIIELHDHLFPGEARSHTFLRCVCALNRDFLSFGENIFSFANR